MIGTKLLKEIFSCFNLFHMFKGRVAIQHCLLSRGLPFIKKLTKLKHYIKLN